MEKNVRAYSDSIDEGIADIASGSSDGTVHRRGGSVFAEGITVQNPKIVSVDNCLKITGEVIFISVAGLVKFIKNHFKTAGENRFPEIVDDFLFGPLRGNLKILEGYDLCSARNDLAILAKIIRVLSDLEKLAAIKSLKPLELIDSIMADDPNITCGFVAPFELPVAITTKDGAIFYFNETMPHVVAGFNSNQSASLGTVFDLQNATIVIEGIENDTIQMTAGLKNVGWGNLMAVSALFSILAGAVSFIEKRLFFFVVFLILGIVLAFIRFLPTRWNKEFFGREEQRITGNSCMAVKFYGEK